MRLYPSQTLRRLLNKYKPVPQQQIVPIIEQYLQTKSNKSATIILNAISKIFAKQISKNESKFIAALGPEATYDDIFNQMTVAIFKFIDRYDPSKTKFNTWVQNALWPITKDPVKLMGNRFNNQYKGKMININKPVGSSESGATIADLIADGDADVQKQLEDQIQDNKLKDAISKLTKQQQQIVKTLFGFIDPKPQWSKVLRNGKVTVNAVTIGKGLGYSPGIMRAKIAKIMQKLRQYLVQAKYDKYFGFDRLIEMYKGRRKFNKYHLLNRKDWELL